MQLHDLLRGQGGGKHVEFIECFQEANWQDTATGTVPPTGTIDGSAPVPIFTGGIIMDQATATYGNYSPSFDLGGNTLHLSGGGTLKAAAGHGLRSNTGGTNSSAIVSGTATLDLQFLLDIDLSLADAANLVLSGAGNPINSSSIDFATDWTGSIHWTGETVSAATSEHLSKITVDGSPASIGSNVALISDGDRVKDGGEIRRGTDPNNAAEFPDLPNVIFILADDLGIGELGAYGQTKILTPALDTLAAEGMRFDAFYSSSAVCAPTRGQLLTGKHAGQAPIRNNGEVGNGYQQPLPADTFTIGTLMQNAGYATSCIGKWGLGGPGTTGEPLSQGFDHFFGYLGQVQAHHYYPSYQWRNRDKALYSQTLATSLDLDDNTIIFFTSDNGVTFLGEVDRGYFNSAAGLRGYKGNIYEGGIRAPMLAWWPDRIPAGSSTSILGNMDDIMPTLADITSTPGAADTTGRSILPTLLGQPNEHHPRRPPRPASSASGTELHTPTGFRIIAQGCLRNEGYPG